MGGEQRGEKENLETHGSIGNDPKECGLRVDNYVQNIKAQWPMHTCICG